jgi:hypothetical protein
MINLANAEWITSLILLILAYIVSVTVNGVLQTLVASRMGDSTAEESGYSSFNPLVHFDLLAFIGLVFFHLGWPRFIPINPSNIYGPYRLIRLLLIHSVETIVSLTFAVLSLAMSVGFFGASATSQLASLMFISESAPLHAATVLLPSYSSLAIVGALLLVSFVFLNIFIAALSLILNGFKYAMTVGFERGYKYMEYADYLTFFGPIVIILFFANPLRYYLLKVIMWGACKIAFLCIGVV